MKWNFYIYYIYQSPTKTCQYLKWKIPSSCWQEFKTFSQSWYKVSWRCLIRPFKADLYVSAVCLQPEPPPWLLETATTPAWGESPELRRCPEVSDQQGAPRVCSKPWAAVWRRRFEGRSGSDHHSCTCRVQEKESCTLQMFSSEAARLCFHSTFYPVCSMKLKP